jgi:transketolase
MSGDAPSLDLLCINTLRTLSIDAVQKANSGHPGTPMGAAPVAYCVWQRFMRYDPKDPDWPNRDRFVLSAGHASALLYSLLHLCSVVGKGPHYPAQDSLAVSMADLQSFRQEGSRCTGHPEYGWTSGVETTTGPLGQGIATSVGMAIAQRWLAATYNRPGHELFDYNVYALCGDGDMMEGVSAEAAALAGHLKLANLCWIYDDNQISIEGSTSITSDEDAGKRFEAYGWKVLRVADANDLEAITQSLHEFNATQDRPTLIIVRSHIGYGAPHKQDTKEAHGEPLGADEVRLAKKFFGFDPDVQFAVPDGVRDHFNARFGERGARARDAWDATYDAYRLNHPELATQLECMERRDLPAGWDSDLPVFPADAKGMASRISGGKSENGIAKNVPWLLGGSADLAPSTKTLIDGEKSMEPGNYGGRNMHFGIREHGMVAAVNGMVLCGLRAFGATFFVFSDYCRPSIRLAAIMKIPTIVVFTHDSIGVGEDGPTHEPIEQLAACRAIPRLLVLRPADANETAQCWRLAMAQTERPSILCLTRQDLPTLDRTKYAPATGVEKGGYVLADAGKGAPDVILMSTGSEVQYAVAAHEKLVTAGIKSRVVSLPSFELFDEQPASYRNEVMPPAVTKRIGIEAGVRQCWDKYLGMDGAFVGLDTYGASAPYQEIYEHRGITADAIVAKAREILGK